MNLVLDISKFTLSNTYFLETKRNVIIDGNFTKFIYSNNLFTMNGMYFLFPIEIAKIDKIANKYSIKFNPYNKTNFQLVKDFSKLEYKLIEFYKQTTGCTMEISNNLSKQIYSGNMKIYRDFSIENLQKQKDTNLPPRFILKVSGVWETGENVCITFKLFQIIE